MIQHRIEVIQDLLARIGRYNTIVLNDTFSKEALSSMKGNVKDFADTAKGELDKIKDEVDNW